MDTNISHISRSPDGASRSALRFVPLFFRAAAVLALAATLSPGPLDAQSRRAGSLDTTFSADGMVTTGIGSGPTRGRAVAVQPDGKIVVAGFSQNGSDNDIVVVRYTAAGALDASFGTNGVVTTDIGSDSDDYGMAIALQSNGRIVVAGRSDGDFAVLRYTAAGALDTSFSGDGKATTDIGNNAHGEAVAVQPDGDIVVAGFSWIGNSFDVVVVRYTAAGALDTSFDSDGMVTRILRPMPMPMTTTGPMRWHCSPTARSWSPGATTIGAPMIFWWFATPPPAPWIRRSTATA